jgi:DNA ligase-associated metallophosphoesterase
MKDIEISFGGEHLYLSPYRAVYWPAKETLILSDLHLGKSAHFRKSGIAVSSLVSENDIARLELLVRHYPTKSIIVVGDLVHAGINSDSIHFKEWMIRNSDLKISLIKGNHDRLAPEQLLAWGLSEVVNECTITPFLFTHNPPKSGSIFTVSGHIHPGVVLDLPLKRRCRFPCFILTPNLLILPAFSEFTGLDTVNHPENAHYYAIVESVVIPI